MFYMAGVGYSMGNNIIKPNAVCPFAVAAAIALAYSRRISLFILLVELNMSAANNVFAV